MAYLSLREHKKPLYFKDIVSEIYNKFDKKVNPATCHNELIRDKRFILVGRGIYGLKE
jgi:DNA-directed RNA polymerase delta subunit